MSFTGINANSYLFIMHYSGGKGFQTSGMIKLPIKLKMGLHLKESFQLPDETKSSLKMCFLVFYF